MTQPSAAEFLAANFARVGHPTVNLQIANRVFGLCADPELLDDFLYSTGHLVTEAATGGRLAVIKRAEVVSQIPRLGELQFGAVEGVEYEYLSELDSLGFRAPSGDQLLILGHAAPNLARPETMRVLIDWLLRGSGLVALHGATVSWGGRTALISNRGGSGKSTTTAACVAAGARSCGDDFLLGDESFTVYSISRTVKLASSSPARSSFATLPTGVGAHQPSADEKDLLLLDQLGQGGMVPSAQPDLLLVPQVSDDWRIGSISSLEVLQAVAPNSVAMNRDRVLALAYVKRLIAELPVMRLEVGPDLHRGVEFLKQVLSA